MRTTSEMKWVDIPDAKGAQQAVAWGNAEQGPHAPFAKFEGGGQIALHSHTAASRSVVITGTMVEGPEGQPPKELRPGSYFFIPGDLKHTTACKAGAQCVIYTDWSGAFDLKPATRKKRKNNSREKSLPPSKGRWTTGTSQPPPGYPHPIT